MKSAYFAGGCFWCITPVFAESKGVISVTSGFCGGDETDPSYEDVKAQKTGHRETIKIEYDENIMSFSALLQIFFDYRCPPHSIFPGSSGIASPGYDTAWPGR